MKAKLIVPLVLLVLLLTGCYSFDSDSLYALPLRSEEYRALQSAVESALGSGSYSAPVSGDNPQPVQQMDLDGDGQEEVLVFCKMDGERPLRVLIFRREEERFTLVCTLDGDGTAFEVAQGLLGSQTALGVIPAGISIDDQRS